MPYQESTFALAAQEGLSEKQVSEHLKLYAGYVKNTNLLWTEIVRLQEDAEKNAVEIAELQRRFGFEFNGMRLHEYYFGALRSTNGLHWAEVTENPLKKALAAQYGSFEAWLALFKKAGTMRGIGWVLLAHDPVAGALHNVWVADHEIGNLAGLSIIHAMDVWEHAYLLDYLPSERKNYIEAFFKNVNWRVLEERFALSGATSTPSFKETVWPSIQKSIGI